MYGENVSTENIGAILEDYIGQTVIVSYDDTDYECTVYATPNKSQYTIGSGADTDTTPDFEDFPFKFVAVNIFEDTWGLNIFAESEGTHDVTIHSVNEITTTIKPEHLLCQYVEDGTGDYAVIINGVDALSSTSEYDSGTPKNIASGDWAIAEGKTTEASGTAAHAEGQSTKAIAEASHTEGEGTIANGKYQHVSGKYNIADSGTAANSWNGTYAEIIGNGTSNSNRSNARTLDWNGNEVLTGGLTVGAAGITIGNTTITEAQLTALLGLLNMTTWSGGNY